MTEIRLFVDDERPAFKGWTLARNIREAMQYFRDDSAYDITEMSLDWYLGHHTLNGIKLAEEMIGHVYYFDLKVFQNTKAIWLHSSDRENAIAMARLFEQAREDGLVNEHCRVRLNENCRIDLGSKP